IYVYDELNGNFLKVNNINGIPANYSRKDLKLRNKNQNDFKRQINRIHDEKVNEVNRNINLVVSRSKYDQKALRRMKISSDNPIIKTSKKAKLIDLDFQESIYADGGLFDVDD